MQLIAMAIGGLFIGLLARFFYPGPVPMGLVASMALGLAGSLFAGFLGTVLHGRGRDEGVPRAGCFWSVLGAMALIYIARHL